MFNLFKRKKRRDAEILLVSQIVCSSEECPTIYEMKLTDGRMAYARYKNGVLEVYVSQGETDRVEDAILGTMIYYFNSGNRWSSIMGEPHFSNHLGLAGVSFSPDLPLF